MMNLSISEISKLDTDELQHLCHSELVGLSSEEAKRRLAKFGRNQLPRQNPKHVAKIFFEQFKNPLAYILLAASAFALIINEYIDVAFIIFVLLINAVIGTIHSYKSERTNYSLQKILKTNTKVLRDKNILSIDAEEIVPGDVIFLESGNTVPADVRLLTSHNLFVDESLLTGESKVIQKSEGDFNNGNNILFAGTTLTRGRSKSMVFRTASETTIGTIARTTHTMKPGKAPIIERMERFSATLSRYVFIVSASIVAFGSLIQDQTTQELIYFAIALAVSAIPEGLPIAMTLSFAIAARRMAKRGVIVKTLPSVEALGSCNIVATDKTGTLTCNEQTVERVTISDCSEYAIDGRGYEPEGRIFVNGQPVDPIHTPLHRIARAAVLCNEAFLGKHNDHWVWSGDPVDIALLTFGAKVGWSSASVEILYEKQQEIPFESENRFSASHFKTPKGHLILAKGSPERIFDMCSDLETVAKLKLTAERYAREGYRTVAIAEKQISALDTIGKIEDELFDLSPLGVLGMRDPLRPGTQSTLERCKDAGVRVLMITGDHPETANKVARELGLMGDTDVIITGDTLSSKLGPDELNIIRTGSVFARITPMQKLKIVQTLTTEGNYVAVTGDGINDVPALHAANIGVALGQSGTDAAREAAGIVITDDNFTSIVAGIEEGRLAYINIRKIILLLLSTGIAEVILVVLCLFLSLPLPLHPIQLLWLNLVTNGLQDVALAFEPKEEDLMRRGPRRPNDPILDKQMIRRIFVSATAIGLLSFFAFKIILTATQDLPFAQSAVLLLMVFFENVHAMSCRSEQQSILKSSPMKNPLLIYTIIGSTVLHIVFTNSLLGQKILRVIPIGWEVTTLLFAVSLSLILATEIEKYFTRREERPHVKS